jgi:hypothetical protein
MEIVLQFSLPYGLNVGFEYYRADEEIDINEFHLNLLIFKIMILWQK